MDIPASGWIYMQTRLLTDPWRITQDGNSLICVINWKIKAMNELVILSLSGMKYVYRGRVKKEKFRFTDAACDSYYYILVCELLNSAIHLLSPKGAFMRYLLTKSDVNHSSSMSMKTSALWVSDCQGLVKVFSYKLSTNE